MSTVEFPDTVLLGTGGHARSCWDALSTSDRNRFAGCVGAAPANGFPLPFLGGDEYLDQASGRGVTSVLVAVGDNRTRQRLLEMALAHGFDGPSFASPWSIGFDIVRAGAGSIALKGAIVGADVSVGSGVILNTACSVDHDGVIGDFAHIAPGTHLAGNVDVGIGAFLGVGVSVIPGVTIGDWATVGAGAVVVEDVPAGATVVGVPARPLNARKEPRE